MSEAEYKAMEKAAPISALWNPSTSGDLPSFDKVMGFSGSPEVITFSCDLPYLSPCTHYVPSYPFYSILLTGDQWTSCYDGFHCCCWS